MKKSLLPDPHLRSRDWLVLAVLLATLYGVAVLLGFLAVLT